MARVHLTVPSKSTGAECAGQFFLRAIFERRAPDTGYTTSSEALPTINTVLPIETCLVRINSLRPAQESVNRNCLSPGTEELAFTVRVSDPDRTTDLTLLRIPSRWRLGQSPI